MPFWFAFLLDTTDGPQTVLPPGKKKKEKFKQELSSKKQKL